MFIDRESNTINKEIMKTKSQHDDTNEIIINIKADTEDQIFSSYNYDNKTSINSELANYLWDNAKLAKPYKKLKLQVFCKEDIEKTEVSNAIKSHYRREYIEIKDELKKTSIFSLICIILGIITLGVLVSLHKVFDNYFLVSIIDIVAWVFIWEAVDAFFLQRTGLKHKCRILMRLYSSEIVIHKNKLNIENKKHEVNNEN